jgi:REP element-mobilizing transposase RayT
MPDNPGLTDAIPSGFDPTAVRPKLTTTSTSQGGATERSRRLAPRSPPALSPSKGGDLPWITRPHESATLKGLQSYHARRIVPRMSQSLSKILVHIVFSTKERRPYLRDLALRTEMHHYLGGILKNLDCQPIIGGGVEDHVHLLCALARTCAASDMVKEVKRGSSIWINTKMPSLQDFRWQSGFGIFSIGFSQVPDVKRYIEDQVEHHHRISYQDEFRTLLNRYEIDDDERYVWD